MKKTKVINIIAGPGAGKSTLVALLFGKMKVQRFDIEMVHEYAKSLVWLKMFEELNNQYHVSLSQFKLLKSLDGVVDYIITDGSLLHGVHYNKSNINNVSNIEKTEAAIKEYYNKFDNINIFIERADFGYEEKGRIENEKEAIEADIALENILINLDLDFLKITGAEENIPEIIKYIKQNQF